MKIPLDYVRIIIIPRIIVMIRGMECIITYRKELFEYPGYISKRILYCHAMTVGHETLREIL